MGDRLSARELVQWTLYAAERPFGEEQADRRAALIAHAAAAAMAGKKAPPLEKFLAALRPDPPKPERAPQGPDELHARMMAYAARSKGKRPARPRRGTDDPRHDDGKTGP